MKTVQFPSQLKNSSAKGAINKTQDPAATWPIDAQVFRQSQETLVQMITEVRIENKDLVQKCHELEIELSKNEETVITLNHLLDQLREELERTNAHLSETLGTNHNWWVRSCELDAELQKIKSRFWWRVRDRFVSIKLPTLTTNFQFPRLNVMDKMISFVNNFIKLLIKTIVTILYPLFKISGISSPLKFLLSRFPRLNNYLLNFLDNKQEVGSHENGHLLKNVIIRQVMRVMKYLEKHPQLATPLKSWLSRKPLLKSRLRRFSHQVPVISKTEYSITEVEGKDREAVDLSGLTPSAKRLYKLSVLERERRSLYDNVPTFVFSEVELEARSGRMLKNLQNYR